MFTPDIKEKVGRLRVEEGRSVKSLSEEFGVSLGSVSRWSRDYRESPVLQTREETIQKLQQENNELKDECERLRAEADHARIEAEVLREVIRTFAPTVQAD